MSRRRPTITENSRLRKQAARLRYEVHGLRCDIDALARQLEASRSENRRLRTLVDAKRKPTTEASTEGVVPEPSPGDPRVLMQILKAIQ